MICLAFVPLLSSQPAALNLAYGAAWFLCLVSISLIAFIGSVVLIRLLSSRGLDYIELFLPRLLGSIVVGLSILLFESTVWDATLQLPWGNWLALTVTAYAASFFYFFLDAHKTTRLLPASELAPEKDPKNNKRKGMNSTSGRSARVAAHVFAIGLLEAFVAVILGSAFLAFSIVSKNLLWKACPLAYQLQIGDQIHLIFLPKVVLLWTGLTLLIGAFAQLLWQDRQITAT